MDRLYGIVLALVEGESGVGKSALAFELARFVGLPTWRWETIHRVA
jgi:2-phosphoglycerate kinase